MSNLTSDKALIEKVAKALYEDIELKKPWDHPKVVKIWHPILKKHAETAIRIIKGEK